MVVTAHFDGKVIVPDEQLNLPIHQALLVQIQIVPAEARSTESAATWILANAVDSGDLPVDLADRHDQHLYGAATHAE